MALKKIKPLIIYYHGLSSSFYNGNPSFSLIDFASQVKWLKRFYHICSLNEFIHKRDNGLDLTNHLVITFDDGFKQIYDSFASILSDYNLTATIFLINNCIDNKDLMWRNKCMVLDQTISSDKRDQFIATFAAKQKLRLPETKLTLLSFSNFFPMANKESLVNEVWESLSPVTVDEFLHSNPVYLTTNEINGLISNGYEIGAHTLSHPFCDKLDKESLIEEVVISKEDLERRFKTKVSSLSLPFGRIPDKQLLEVCNGYDLILTTNKSLPHRSVARRLGLESGFRQSFVNITKSIIHPNWRTYLP